MGWYLEPTGRYALPVCEGVLMVKKVPIVVTVPFRINRHQLPAFLFMMREAAGENADRIMDEIVVKGKEGDITGADALQAYIDAKWKEEEDAK